MKRLLFLLFAPLLLWLVNAEMSFVNKTIDSKYTKIITVGLDWNHYVVSSISKTAKPLKDLVNQVQWVAWINGSYFCPSDYTQCWGSSYTYSYRKFLSYEDNDIYWQSNKTIFWITYDWVPIVKTRLINTTTDIAFWISNFPAILIGWVNVLNYEWLTLKNIVAWTKAFICSNNSWTVIKMGFVYRIPLSQMPNYLRKNLWCWNALNLDWGGSLALKYKNQYLKQWRNIMDAFIVVTSWVWQGLMSWHNTTVQLFTWNIYTGSWEKYKRQQTLKSYQRLRAEWKNVRITNGWIVHLPNTCSIWDTRCIRWAEINLRLLEIITGTH